MKVRVGGAKDFVEGRLRGIVAEGKQIVIGRYKGELYAMDGRCSHMGYDLSNGKFMDGVVTCPLHGAQFDIRTGQKLTHSGAKDLRTYVVTVEGEDVFLDI